MEKKTRRDKGQSRWTARDIWLMPWIGEQYGVRFDQLLQLLSRQPLGETQEEGWVGEATVRHWIERWRKMGLIGYASLLVGQPGWVWLTRKGMQTLGQEYRMWTPNPARLQHIYYCTEVRLMNEDRKNKLAWRSERMLRKEQEALKKGERARHLPDAELVFENGAVAAIEVELTVKEPDWLDDILTSLGARYNAVWYYTLPRVTPHIQKAFDKIPTYQRHLREKFSLAELEENWE